MTRHVAITANYSWAGITSPLINTIGYLVDNGYAVDLYLERPDLKRFPLPGFVNERANVVITGGPGRGIVSDAMFAFNRRALLYRYEAVVAFDYQAVLRAWFLSKAFGGVLIYHNLEFLVPSRLRDYRNKVRELFGARVSRFIVTQDELRADWLAGNLHTDRRKFRVVENSSRGLSATGESGYFRRAFSIPNGRRIVLCLGSLIREHYVEEVTAAARYWSDDFVLVLHGWFPDARVRRSVLALQQETPDRIFISEALFDDSEKFIPSLSCDIGFVGFASTGPNHYLAGKSAGKLFDFMKAGKPLLARDAPGISRLVEGQQLGAVFRDPDEIEGALNRIVADYDRFRENCSAGFRQFEFDLICSRFWREVNSAAEAPLEAVGSRAP